MPQSTARYFLPFLFLLALLARAPTLGLPLEGQSAVLASVADHLGHERGWALAGHPPLMPLLVSLLVASNVPATLALRWCDAILAALLAPLLVLVGRRLGLAASPTRFAGLILAVHPLALAQAGGLAPGSASLGAALILCALVLLLAEGRGSRRVGAACALLLPLADPFAALYLPGFLLCFVRREPSQPFAWITVALGTCLLLLGPGAPAALLGSMAWAGASALGALLLVLLLGAVIVLGLGLPRGLATLWRTEGGRGALARAWILSGALHALVLVFVLEAAPLPWGVVGPALGLLPLVLLASVAGLTRRATAWSRRLAWGAVGGAAVVSVWLVWGGLQVALAPGVAGAAGRLHLLRTAVTDAATLAGDGGWVVLAVAEGRPAEQTSLADLHPGQWVWARRSADDSRTHSGLRQLLTFPAGAFQAGHSVMVVAEAGATGPVATFDGAGIYRQEVIRQVGPYVVLRARRP